MTLDDEPRTLAGRYRLDEVIGRGGMSTVYRGTDLALDRVVAVKVALDPLVEQSPVYLERFTREAHSTAVIGHPGVVTVYDAGADGPTRFIVMEYVKGQSLADLLREQSPLQPARAAEIAAEVADALSAAHSRGIVHRDIKPANIMILPDGSVKVLDFGIARAVDSGTLTQTATVLGTSAYMSPEQAMGQPADARSDIYSLGCVLYEMLTGEPPFMAEISAAVLHQHVRVAPKSARERNPDVPPALDALVTEMLAKSPGDRPQTAAEVRDRLRREVGHLGGAGGTSATLAMAAAAPPPPPPATVPPQEPTPRDTAPVPPQEPTPGDPAPAPVPEAAPSRAAPSDTAASRSATSGTPPPPPTHRAPSRSRAGLWAAFGVIAALLLGAAVALALNGTGGNATTSDHSTPPITSSHESNGNGQPPASQSAPKSTPTTTLSHPTTSTPHTTTTNPATTTTTTTTGTTTGTTSASTPTTGGTTP